MTIWLPAYCLVALVGPSGAGKSTFAARWFRPSQVLSSDAFRAAVADDPNDQSATLDAFDVLHLVLSRRLARRRLTVIDATNLDDWARADLVRLATMHGAPAVGIVFDIGIEALLERRQGRGDRLVPPRALRRQQWLLQRARRTLPHEGFAAVHVLESAAEVDAARVSVSSAASGAAGGA